MGLAHSISLQEENEEEEDDDDDEEEEEEEEEEGNGEENLMQETPNIVTYEGMEKNQHSRAAMGDNPNNHHRIFKSNRGNGIKNHKVFSAPKLDISDKLEQDPEMVPFESSASPVSLVSTPHLSNSMIRVWDPSHILNPSINGRTPVSFTADHIVDQSLELLHAPVATNVSSPAHTQEICTEIYLIRHAESSMNTLPELIGGRSPSATVTPDGRREARALGVFLLSHGLHFDAVFSSSLERCKQTAVAVCQEVNFAREKIEFSDALVELSQGQWEGLRRSEVYTPELLNVMANSQPDFHAPGGESQRQVEFRMIEFLNNVILPRAIEASLSKDTKAVKTHTKTNPLMQVHPLNYDEEYDGTKAHGVLVPSSVRAYSSNNSSHAKTSGKSRLRIASSDETTNVVMDVAQGARADTGHSEEKAVPKPSPYSVAVFSHGMAIKCLLRGILGSDPRMTHRVTIDNTSMTVLRHSTYTGWHVLRVNDTAHLRLL